MASLSVSPVLGVTRVVVSWVASLVVGSWWAPLAEVFLEGSWVASQVGSPVGTSLEPSLVGTSRSVGLLGTCPPLTVLELAGCSP